LSITGSRNIFVIVIGKLSHETENSTYDDKINLIIIKLFEMKIKRFPSEQKLRIPEFKTIQ